jgi:hypothetical protein
MMRDFLHADDERSAPRLLSGTLPSTSTANQAKQTLERAARLWRYFEAKRRRVLFCLISFLAERKDQVKSRRCVVVSILAKHLYSAGFYLYSSRKCERLSSQRLLLFFSPVERCCSPLRRPHNNRIVSFATLGDFMSASLEIFSSCANRLLKINSRHE